jgi:hypothetical protein
MTGPGRFSKNEERQRLRDRAERREARAERKAARKADPLRASIAQKLQDRCELCDGITVARVVEAADSGPVVLVDCETCGRGSAWAATPAGDALVASLAAVGMSALGGLDARRIALASVLLGVDIRMLEPTAVSA